MALTAGGTGGAGGAVGSGTPGGSPAFLEMLPESPFSSHFRVREFVEAPTRSNARLLPVAMNPPPMNGLFDGFVRSSQGQEEHQATAALSVETPEVRTSMVPIDGLLSLR